MSSTTYPDLVSPVRANGRQLKVSKESIATLTEVWNGPFITLATASQFQIDFPNPDFPGLWIYGADLVERKGKNSFGQLLGSLTVEYRGLDPAFSGADSEAAGGTAGGSVGGNPSGDATPPPIYTLEASTGTTPIDAHPKFITHIGGTAASPLNGAEFDPETDIFTGFDSTSTYRGISSYLDPGSIWTKSYLAYAPPGADINNVGKIDIPEGGAPTPVGEFNWISLGCSYSKQGGIYQIQKSWRLSGKDGWKPVIYS